MRQLVTGIFGLALIFVCQAGAVEHRINTWLACGTFACPDLQAFETDPADPASIVPAPGVEMGGKWWQVCDDRLYCRNMDDYVDLYTFFSSVRPGSGSEPTVMRSAYVHTYVWSPVDQPVELVIGANDGYKVWLNGQVLRSQYDLMADLVREKERIPGVLHAGWNKLLMKVQNGSGIWGFYAKLQTPQEFPLSGLEYSTEPPEGPLRVVTESLPDGYAGQPYVWLDVNARGENCVPSASPFRLMAAGGVPPYTWGSGANGNLPQGLRIDAKEGEILGKLQDLPGQYRFEVTVYDSTGNKAARNLSMSVNDRVTRWMEDAPLGGLIHGAKGYAPPHGDPVQQAELMAREGYGFAYPTTGWLISPENWPGNFDKEKFWSNPDLFEKMNGKPTSHQDVSAYVSAFQAQGIRFGSYVGLPDNLSFVFKQPADYEFWPCYLDALHKHFQDLCVEYSPAALYLDGLYLVLQEGCDWNLDAMYSLVKTLIPECLIVGNLASEADQDYRAGDADIVSVEGNNDAEAYWARWPIPSSGKNSKYVPIASWRYPFAWNMWEGTERTANRKTGEPDYVDWQEWLRVVISLLGEGYICDLDHSFGFGREEMHAKIGNWMQNRKESIIGTHPGPLAEADWGYDLLCGNTIYLHLLKNPRGKAGINGRTSLKVGPMPGTVSKISLYPGNVSLIFNSEGDMITIDLVSVEPDPVSTILAVEFAP
jgi:hypothetical protein